MNGGARTLVSAWQRSRRSVQASTRPYLAYGPIPCFCLPWRCLGIPWRCLAQLLLHLHRPPRAERPPSPHQSVGTVTDNRLCRPSLSSVNTAVHPGVWIPLQPRRLQVFRFLQFLQLLEPLQARQAMRCPCRICTRVSLRGPRVPRVAYVSQVGPAGGRAEFAQTAEHRNSSPRGQCGFIRQSCHQAGLLLSPRQPAPRPSTRCQCGLLQQSYHPTPVLQRRWTWKRFALWRNQRP